MMNDDQEHQLITPQSKILQVLESYPQLEDLLISYMPAFKKLRNPVLRNTVARVTTMQQVASIANLKVGDLINLLRKEVGQELIEGEFSSSYNFSQPDWFDAAHVKIEFDAREMLSKGEQPVNQVMADLKNLPAGDIYKLIAPFLPAPLIDKALSLDIEHWVLSESDERVIIYFWPGN